MDSGEWSWDLSCYSAGDVDVNVWSSKLRIGRLVKLTATYSRLGSHVPAQCREAARPLEYHAHLLPIFDFSSEQDMN